MPKRIAIDYVELEPGVYRSELVKVEDIPEGGQFGPYTKWYYKVLEEGFEDIDLRGNTSFNFGPQAKARMWAEALLGRRIDRGETIELDDLIGRQCELTIRMEETERGVYPRIDSVNAVRRKTRSKGNPAEASRGSNAEDFEDLPF